MATETLNRLLILLLLLLLHTQPALSASASPASSPSISPSSSSASPPPPPPPASSSSRPSTSAPPAEKSSPSSPSALDPKQLMALKSLGVPASSDPCSAAIATCDSSTPFRHVVSLRLANCSSDLQMSPTALKTLSSISSLSFVDCPFDPVHLPEELSSNLRSFSCVRSLHRLTGVWLSRLGNVTALDVRDVPINASGPTIILSKMEDLRLLKISGTNLTGFLPKKWPLKITDIDLSNNDLKGSIPTPITLLSDLKSLNLSSNKLTGTIPSTIGDLLTLQNMSLASNSLQGSLPDSLSTIPSLVHLDLSSNQLNGSIPRFLAKMKSLKYLNLENNEFQGIFPFNASFISTMTVFRIGGNSNLCYNTSAWSSKIKLGISPCDKNGLPIVPPDSSNSPASAPGNDDNAADSSLKDRSSNQHHGPSTVVLVVAIGLSTIVFLIVFCILLSRWCS